MIWHYYAKDLKPWEVPVQEILKGFHLLASGKVKGRYAHTPIEYLGYRTSSFGASSVSASSSRMGMGTSTQRTLMLAALLVVAILSLMLVDGDGSIDAMQDGGYFARYGEPQRQSRGEHAGRYVWWYPPRLGWWWWWTAQ